MKRFLILLVTMAILLFPIQPILATGIQTNPSSEEAVLDKTDEDSNPILPDETGEEENVENNQFTDEEFSITINEDDSKTIYSSKPIIITYLYSFLFLAFVLNRFKRKKKIRKQNA